MWNCNKSKHLFSFGEVAQSPHFSWFLKTSWDFGHQRSKSDERRCTSRQTAAVNRSAICSTTNHCHKETNARLTGCQTRSGVRGNAPYGEDVMKGGATQGVLNMPSYSGAILLFHKSMPQKYAPTQHAHMHAHTQTTPYRHHWDPIICRSLNLLCPILTTHSMSPLAAWTLTH